MRQKGRYSVELRDKARDLRRNQTYAEDQLWRYLRDRSLMPAKFRRQHPVGPFILDFYCHEHRLAIEIDGGQHFEPDPEAYDERRTAFLQGHGIRVLRFTNLDVLNDTTSVLEVILEVFGEPSPNPPPEGEGSSSATRPSSEHG